MERTRKSADVKVGGSGLEREKASKGATITRVRIEALFGLYTYDFPAANSNLGRTPILYGENGLGKTNVLRILFHLLSPANDRGHRTALSKIKFRKVEVYLSNNVMVSGTRSGDKLDGAMRVVVERLVGARHELLGAWNWYPEDDPGREASHRWLGQVDPELVRTISEKSSTKERKKVMQEMLFQYIEKESNPLENELAFLRALEENVPPIFFLTADRTLISDGGLNTSTAMPDYDARVMRPELMVTKGRERALNEAISQASRRLSQLAVRATRQGSKSMHSIYQDLIRRLAMQPKAASKKTPETVAELTQSLLDLSGKYDMYAKYGLAPKLQGNQLVKLLASVRPAQRSAAGEVLRPYVESLTEQAKGLAKAYSIIDTFISTVNDFLYDKSAEFSLGEGMIVRNKLGGVLEPRDLSSGEQQLLLLFCHITLAHSSGGIFIIDEPEISLNIKWQRRPVDALLHLDPSDSLQFFLASHSMEILTRHRDSVVPLREPVSE